MRLVSSHMGASRGIEQMGARMLLFGLALVFCAPAAAQSYREETVGDQFRDPKSVRSYKSRKGGVLKGSISMSEGANYVQEYYTKYVFPAMTRRNYRGQLAILRNELIMDLAQAKDPEARAAAYKTILDYGIKLAKNEAYHPATRYNALLLLGQLNKTESTDNKPPSPDKAVLSTLVGPLRSKESAPMLRYAAILGVLRHAEICGPPKAPGAFSPRARKALTGLLLPIAMQQGPPDGVDDAAHAWLRTRAVEAIGHLRYKGEPDVVQPLADLLVDEDADLDLRCAAAEALGRMARELDPNRAEDLVDRMAKLIVDSSNAESLALYEILTAGRRGGRESGYSVAPPRRREGAGLPDLEGGTRRRGALTEDDIADKRTMPSRQRHLFQLLTVKRGLTGDVRTGVDGISVIDGAQSHVNRIMPLLDKMIEDVRDIESDLQQLGGKLQKSRQSLMTMIPESLGAHEDEGVDLETAAEMAEAQPAEETAEEPAEEAPEEAGAIPE